MPKYKIIHSDCLDAMKEMKNNSIDFIVTDSPYGVSFMSKHWDKEIPPPEYWREMLRICKPGSYMACAGLPRMMHRLTSIVEDSGWIIRDMIIHIFGSGFPKSNNFGKKLGEPWNGYGTALKPAWEGWTLAMKPLDGTFAQNAEKWGVGGINIDGCRIGTNEEKYYQSPNHENSIQSDIIKVTNQVKRGGAHNSGRWPANLILSPESAEQLDQMTGVLKTGGGVKTPINGKLSTFRNSIHQSGLPYKADSGGASRYFYCAKASSNERNKGLEGMPLKQSKRIGDMGACDNQRPNSHSGCKESNTHPCVKPISLMKYIITLLAPPGNPILLDPFCGSGSTLVGAKELGISAIGIEKEKEYVEIAQKRLDTAKCSEQMEMF